MSNVFTSAGTEIYIGASMPATYDKAGFEAVVWTKIGEVTDLGEFGREYSVVTHNPLGDRRTIKRKGSYNEGAVSMSMGKDVSDVGQVALSTALDSDDSYPFKVVLQDTTHLYFSGQVISFTTNVGSVDQITGVSCSIEIDNDILEEVAPA